MTATAAAVTFTWLGMVLGISFIETPLKFRAPGITVPLGLGIGRLVFRALNAAELVLAVVIAALLLAYGPTATEIVVFLALVGCLAAQIVLVRPVLNRRTDRFLAGDAAPGSKVHLFYIALEVAKVALLVTLGAVLL